MSDTTTIRTGIRIGRDGAGGEQYRPRFALTAMALLIVALGSCTAGQPTDSAGTPSAGTATPTVTTSSYAPATGSGPSRLQNMSASQVVAMLGEPAFKREENPAQVWRYTSKNCVLELFLYRLDKDLQVRHVETRDGKANPVPQDNCIAVIAAQKKVVATK